MQNRKHRTDPLLAELRVAVRRVMKERNHTQAQLSEITGINQGHLSRFLAGGGKRMTNHLLVLCKYADFDAVSHREPPEGQKELSQLLSEVIGDNATAAQALLAVVQALAPVLRALPHSPESSGDVR